MFRIEKKILKRNTVEIVLEGGLDDNSINVLDQICQRYIREEKKININFQNLTYISREGKNYLIELREKVHDLVLPDFMKL